LSTFEPIKEYKFFTISECDKIKEYAYRKEDELIKEGHNHAEEFESITTSNYFRYNFLRDHPIYAARFVDFLRQTNDDLEWPIAVQSWVNIYRRGDGIRWHNHVGNMGTSFAANIFIDGPTKPGTIYLKETGYEINELPLENKRGYIQIFPTAILHKVNPVENERVSIGITLHSCNYMRENKQQSGVLILSEDLQLC
jgi:hypothetical protein